MSKFYSIKSIEDFIQKNCVDCLFASDSVIGLGNQIWTMTNGRFFVILFELLVQWTQGPSTNKIDKTSTGLD